MFQSSTYELDEATYEDIARTGGNESWWYSRLSNPNDHWHEHDLIDVLFLPCAAEYGDYVVCEKKTADYLWRTGRKRPGGAVVGCSSPHAG